VTVFDRDVAGELERAVRNVRVMSIADIVVPTLAGPCLDDRLLSVHRKPGGLRATSAADGRPQIDPIELSARSRRGRLLADIHAMLRPRELSAKILVGGTLGFCSSSRSTRSPR
jgi:hypothetical protein